MMLYGLALAAGIIAAIKISEAMSPGFIRTIYAILLSWLSSFGIMLALGIASAASTGGGERTFAIAVHAAAIGVGSIIWIAPIVLFFRWRETKAAVAHKGAAWP